MYFLNFGATDKFMIEEESEKIEEPKTIVFKSWLESRPFWEQNLWKLHLEKESVDEADIDKCYQVFLEDQIFYKSNTQRKSLALPNFGADSSTVAQTRFTLDKIENLKNINAVVDKCAIEFGEKLTVIYGDNGTGKSGVGRLFSNACLSRKPRKLLSNAKVDPFPVSSTAKADFHISDSNGTQVISYTMGASHESLKCFSVFDNECAPIHLNSENDIKFIPSKIQIFDDVFKSIVAVEDKLKKESETRKKDNPTEGLFSGATRISDFLNSLSHTTTIKEIDRILNFTANDQLLIDEKNKIILKKQKQDIAKQKNDLMDECADLGVFQDKLKKTTEILSEEKVVEINKLIDEIEEKKKITDKLSIRNFEFVDFRGIGGEEWRALIVAAKKLYEKETALNEGAEPKRCVLCRQTLNLEEKTLFKNYWEFLKSTAESELYIAKQNLSKVLEKFKQAHLVWPIFADSEAAIKILKRDIPKDLKKIQDNFGTIEANLLDWIDKIKKEQGVIYTDVVIDISPISDLITQKRENEKKLIDPTDVIEKIKKYLLYLEQKKIAHNLKDKIKEYVSWLKWEYEVRQINFSGIRGSLTRKKTEIMNKLVVSQYVDIFNEETKNLDCNFGVNVESHGRDANTMKELKLGFAPGCNPGDILSEGEQTVAVLADFLTEARMDENNCGLIFDDPVNSLDHGRRSIIAKRLAQEANERQIIIFTHDIIFLFELQSYAERNSIDCKLLSMRKNGEDVGVVKSELPWVAQKVKAKVGHLRNELKNLLKLENGDQDIYRISVTAWYEQLRESWERAVEERLFNGVVQRFNKSIQTNRLSAVSVTPELVKEVENGMTEASGWLHDNATGINPVIPKNNKLKADLDLLDAFITKCLPS